MFEGMNGTFEFHVLCSLNRWHVCMSKHSIFAGTLPYLLTRNVKPLNNRDEVSIVLKMVDCENNFSGMNLENRCI